MYINILSVLLIYKYVTEAYSKSFILPASTRGAGFFCGKILQGVINVLHLQYEKTN